MADFHVYIMSNATRVLYIGVTNDLERRVWQHKQRNDPESFTARYNLTMLVFAEACPDPRTAIEREKQLKGWKRDRKLALIEQQNPGWVDLSADWYG